MLNKNKQRALNFGFVIISTPGARRNGFLPLIVDSVKAGEPITGNLSDFKNVAVWKTEAEAEAAMEAITPEGKSPAVYAGLSVRPAFQAIPAYLVHGLAEGMNGFELPSYF